MYNFKGLIKTLDLSVIVREICLPLLENTPVEHFSCTTWSKNGFCKFYTTSQEWGKYIEESDHFLNQNEFNFFDFIPETLGFFLESHYKNPMILEYYKKTYLDVCNKKIGKCLSYIKQDRDKIYIFNFWGKESIDHLENYFLSNTVFFEYFIKYFIENIQPYEDSIELIQLPSNKIKELKDYLPKIQPIKKDLPKFLVSSYPQLKLTNRQKEILKWYLSGKTAEETAIILGISKRTVEGHFFGLKEKWDAKQNLK